MINQQRNERFWTKGCGYTSKPTVHKVGVVWPTETGRLPDPSDLSFAGYLLRDGLAAIRKKWPGAWITMYASEGEEACVIRSGFEGIALCRSGTLSEAMFNAFEKALGLDKEEK